MNGGAYASFVLVIASIYFCTVPIGAVDYQLNHPDREITVRDIDILEIPDVKVDKGLEYAGSPEMNGGYLPVATLGRSIYSPKVYKNFALKFHLVNQTDKEEWIMAMIWPRASHVRVYKNCSGWQKLDELFAGINRSFVLEIPPQVSCEILVLVTDSYHTIVLQNPLVIKSVYRYAESSRSVNTILGLYSGILLTSIIFSLAVWKFLQIDFYLYYALYVSFYGLWSVFKVGITEFVGHFDAPVYQVAGSVSIGLASFFFVLFSVRFLEINRHYPRLAKYIIRLYWLELIYLLGVNLFAPDWHRHIVLTQPCYYLIVVVVILLVFLAFRQNRKLAIEYMVPFSFLLAGLSVYAVLRLGSGPLAGSNLNLVFLGGSGIEILLFSIVLGKRIHTIYLDKEALFLRNRETEQKISEMNERALHLQMTMLKKVIQPHFLMNSLSVMISLVREDADRAIELFRALAVELRSVISLNTEREITLVQELNLCRTHLTIMSIRREIECTIRTRNLAGDEMVPPLLFHTLVENAFTHNPGAKKIRFYLWKYYHDGFMEYVFRHRGNVPLKDRPGREDGVGTAYIRTRLEETGGGCSQKPLPNGWETRIRIKI